MLHRLQRHPPPALSTLTASQTVGMRHKRHKPTLHLPPVGCRVEFAAHPLPALETHGSAASDKVGAELLQHAITCLCMADCK